MKLMLNPRWLIVVAGIWLLFVNPCLRAQPSPGPGGADLAKIRRYLSLDMYNEAAEALKPAIKTDEFNDELRYLYGLAQQSLKKYDDAISNFRLAYRLNANHWEAADHLVQCYSATYAQSSSNEDRILLGEAATQLVSIRAAITPDSGDEASLRGAQERSRNLLSMLNSPVGTWSDGRLRLTVSLRDDGSFKLDTTAPKNGLFFGTFRKGNDGVEFEGSLRQSRGLCVFRIKFTLRSFDSGTRLALAEQSAEYDAPDPLSGNPSWDEIGARGKACKKQFGKNANSNSMFSPVKLSLDRVQ